MTMKNGFTKLVKDLKNKLTPKKLGLVLLLLLEGIQKCPMKNLRPL